MTGMSLIKKTAVYIIALLLLAGASASAAEKTVGVIMTGNIPYYREIQKAFTEGLTAEGLSGKAEIIQQSPNPEPMSWTNAARKLVAVGADIIVSYGAPATLAVLHETSDIPVVFAGVYDPQSIGVVGKNATGVSSKVPIASLLRNFKSITGFTTLGIVYSEAEKDTLIQVNEARQQEGALGFRSVKFNVRRAEDTSKIAHVDALFLTTGCAAMHCVNNTLGIARKARIATATTIGGGENSGIILTLAANPQEQGREAAKIVAKIIRGARPGAIPVQMPKRIDMIINLREANEIGVKIPFDLLTAATRVIK